MVNPVERLEQLLAQGKDSALLRFSLGSQYLAATDAEHAALHFAAAVALDPRYSAAWKLLGKSLSQAGRRAEAIEAFRRGIEVATERGDKQAAREMGVFLKRLELPAGERT
jgi:Tfp pilus assembly protein PilF